MIDVDVHWSYMVPPGILLIIAGAIFTKAEALGSQNLSVRTLRTAWHCAGIALGWTAVALIKHGTKNGDGYATAVGIGLILGGIVLIFGGFLYSNKTIIKRSKPEYISVHAALKNQRTRNEISPSERVKIAQNNEKYQTFQKYGYCPITVYRGFYRTSRKSSGMKKLTSLLYYQQHYLCS